jgi:YD repeat-containing protein
MATSMYTASEWALLARSWKRSGLSATASGLVRCIHDMLSALAVAALISLQFYGLYHELLVELPHAPDGSLSRRYEFDVPSGALGKYFVEHQYQGFGGQSSFQQRPGSGVQVSQIDGIGRVAWTATVVPRQGASGMEYTFELARTDYEYDGDNNIEKVHRWERIRDASSGQNHDDVLGHHNAVRSTTLNWHDVHRRLVASAELGTERLDGLFTTNGTDPAAHGWFVAETRPEIDPGLQTIERGNTPVDIPLTVYRYDRDGNQQYIASPDGRVTRFYYSGAKRLGRKVEDCFGAQRTTEYVHRFGRLAEIIAHNGEHQQHTVVDFGYNLNPPSGPVREGAEVVDMGLPASGDRVVSRHGSHVRSLHMPGPTGAVSSAPSLFLRYDFHGRLVERVDARGIAVRYEHDDLGRLKSVEIGHYTGEGFAAGYPDSTLLPDRLAPADRIGYIHYEYFVDMQSYEAFAYTERNGTLVAHNVFEFDGRGNLQADWQLLGIDYSAGTYQYTAYQWDLRWSHDGEGGTPVVGHKRLEQMFYPDPPEGWTPRALAFSYGSAGSADDLYSRLTAIQWTGSSMGTLARFGYVGHSRRAWMELGDDREILQDFGLATDPQQVMGLLGLDKFGRVKDLHWRAGPSSAPGGTLARVEYAYDLMGNRIESVRTPRPVGGVDPATRQEQTSLYDEFNRLSEWEATNYNASSVGSLLRKDQWHLDLLGNWSERHIQVQTDPWLKERHLVDGTNRISGGIQRQQQGGVPYIELTEYDEAGNLRLDGQHVYQYDAWNRLIQVNRAVWDGPTLTTGVLVKHYTYDAVGRLARTLSPYPDPDNWDEQTLRSERYFYDGIRRIQEVVVDGLPTLAFAQGDPGLGAMAASCLGACQHDVDGDALPAALEARLLDNEEPEPPEIPEFVVRLSREYVWGPGDRGVDELLAQFDHEDVVTFVLQDEGGDAIALCDLGGSGGAARVVAQYTYDPYGQVITHEHLHAHAWLHAGHKGLFVDRLDLGVASSAGDDQPRLASGANILAYNRNRTLKPDLGRYLQQDPNATGLVLVATMAHSGAAGSSEVSLFSFGDSNRDGANLYQYVRSNPMNASDPLGLYMWGDWADTLATGRLVLQLAGLVVETGQFLMEEAVDWALDWERADDDIEALAAIGWALTADTDEEVQEIAGIWGPAIAQLARGGGGGARVRMGGGGRGQPRADRVQEAFKNWLDKGPKDVSVYIGRTKTGKPKAVYTGISNSVPRRENELGLKLKPFMKGLTRNQARAIEQKIIQANPQFRNINNSISPKHRYSQFAAQWATKKIGGKNIKF